MAALLGSSPLLLQSWRLCAVANSAKPESFTAEVIGDVAYVAFSAVQILPADGRELVDLEGGAEKLFWPLNRHREELREPAMADSGILKIFLNFFTKQNLLEKVSSLSCLFFFFFNILNFTLVELKIFRCKEVNKMFD